MASVPSHTDDTVKYRQISDFSGPLQHYMSLVRDGTLREDQQQKAVLERLDEIHNVLKTYSNNPTSFLSKVRVCAAQDWAVKSPTGLQMIFPGCPRGLSAAKLSTLPNIFMLVRTNSPDTRF